jgi:hypothetical protein
MTRERLSRLQHLILTWLLAEERRMRGTMAASQLVQELLWTALTDRQLATS